MCRVRKDSNRPVDIRHSCESDSFGGLSRAATQVWLPGNLDMLRRRMREARQRPMAANVMPRETAKAKRLAPMMAKTLATASYCVTNVPGTNPRADKAFADLRIVDDVNVATDIGSQEPTQSRTAPVLLSSKVLAQTREHRPKRIRRQS